MWYNKHLKNSLSQIKNVHIKLKDSSLYICTFKLIQDLLRHIFFQELTKSP